MFEIFYQSVKAFYRYEGPFAWGSSFGTICQYYFAAWKMKTRFQFEADLNPSKICALVGSFAGIIEKSFPNLFLNYTHAAWL